MYYFLRMRYFYPNRPLLVSPDSKTVDEMDANPNCVAEIKKNGDRLVLIKKDGQFTFYNRHRSVLKYQPIPAMLEELQSLNIPDGTQLDAELMHNHTKNVKNLIYFYDIYVWGGDLMTEAFGIRRKQLEDLFFVGHDGQHLELAKQYHSGFHQLFNEVIQNDEDEGLVMKNLKGELVFDRKKSVDVWWQVKVRRASKNSRI